MAPPPHGTVHGDFVDTPQTTTILGAAKVTGRLPSGLTVGALAGITDDERARTFDVESGEVDQIVVEPLTEYGVLRLQQQIGENASTLGLTLTAMNRDFAEAEELAARVPEHAFAGGLDWNRRFDDGWYEILGHVGFSHIAGDTAAIARIQRSSAHFFQRPDADHLVLDPTRTSHSGWSAALRGGKRLAEGWPARVGSAGTGRRAFPATALLLDRCTSTCGAERPARSRSTLPDAILA